MKPVSLIIFTKKNKKLQKERNRRRRQMTYGENCTVKDDGSCGQDHYMKIFQFLRQQCLLKDTGRLY